MLELKTLKQLFQRYRRPGDFFFATSFLVVSLFLLSQIAVQTEWRSGTRVTAQPALWPIISIIGMVFFATLNWVSAFTSSRLPGRWKEVGYWIRSLEFVLWFMSYVAIVPFSGYLLSSIAFSLALGFRMGYRKMKILASMAITAIAIVLLFKTFLQVKVPAGLVYDYLPDALRRIMQTYF